MKGLISVIVVNCRALECLIHCFVSLLKIDNGGYSLEIIMADNGSQDGSVSAIRDKFPEIKIIENPVNNYAKALNLGINATNGVYVGVLNPDTIVEKNWLIGILGIMTGHDRIGAVQSKILFSDEKTIKSVGVEDIGDLSFHDIGFDEKDTGQYEKPIEINFLADGSVFFRRDCLADVGPFDEDFVTHAENIDYSIRCRDKGWRLFYSPKSIGYCHSQSAPSSELDEYDSSRNRVLLLGKHFPYELAGSIKASRFYLKNEMDNLYRSLIQAVKKMAEYQSTEIVVRVLDDLKEILPEVFGPRRAANFFCQLEVVLGLRKIRIGIYDHAFHFAGGGQRYSATLAEILQFDYDITFIANKEITLERYKEWFGLDLSDCKLKIIKIPFFEKAGWNDIDESTVINEETNPFDIISQESLHYDIFINANMLAKVKPLSGLSIFICHFPDRPKERFFSVDQYDYLITNGDYGSFWVRQKWGLNPTLRLYPPVNMYQGGDGVDGKAKIILSVARFESGGSKKQLEMIRAFRKLSDGDRRVKQEWRFIMVGASADDNPYLTKVKREIKAIKATNIELMPNLNNSEILKLYGEASIFWHACGLGETDPHLAEHFGMTTVEAMQNYCVPIVMNRGGQREIVEHEINGFLFSTVEELISWTLKVMDDDELRKKIAQGAYEKSHRFNADMFKKHALSFFANVENRLRGGEPLRVVA